MMKSVQTVISHSFAKAKTQVAKGSRKNPRRTASRKISRKSNFLCMSCCLCWVTVFLCRQPQQASQPASQPASRSRPASSSSSTEEQVFQGKIEKPRRISAKAARKPRETAKVENIRERYLAPAKSFSKFSSSSTTPCARMLPERNLFSFDISDNSYRSITLLYNIPIEFPNRKRIAAKAAAKAPRKLCESKPGLYKKVIGVFEAAQLTIEPRHRRGQVSGFTPTMEGPDSDS